MSTNLRPRGRVAVIGAEPAGMATAPSIDQAGHDVALLERYRAARPTGNILNLWPRPAKALGLLGVDIADLGAPGYAGLYIVSHSRTVQDSWTSLGSNPDRTPSLREVVGDSSPSEIVSQIVLIDEVEQRFAARAGQAL